ncbi:OmpA family protein [Teredinibacter sp. KSP-S5-2]|uniref:OmpA family protein n=1 Tax=Teredinibacter sp. KSP-S5-2 TaxID=3034506 RepID=UPI0029345A62|nr:OmpA family protein [Teredinibacter sp. KSP-S5-2]WNO09813.1 OmpA family protein [Teredinibacter sp. KSP-S5-2]
MKKLLVVLCSISLIACVSTDPYTGEQKTSNTAKGAAAGAIAGAVIGAATSSDKDRDKGILTGAVAGAAIGGGVGFYMDKQEAKLRERLQGTGVQVRREGNNIYLVMPGNITFDTGRYYIRTSFYPVLDSVAEVLAEFKKTVINVSGHTDSTGSAEFNQTLSEQRASSVKQYLTQRGVASGRVQAIGYGKRYPVASNASEAGRQANRRVELKLEPLE